MQGRRVVEDEMKQHGLEMIKCLAPRILYAYYQAAFIHFSFSTLSSLLFSPPPTATRCTLYTLQFPQLRLHLHTERRQEEGRLRGKPNLRRLAPRHTRRTPGR